MARNAIGPNRLALAARPLLRWRHAFEHPHHAMNHHLHRHDRRGACGRCVRLDAGAATGPIVVDSNRPAIGAGSARGLLKQFVAAH
jgi:hypothetical protein